MITLKFYVEKPNVEQLSKQLEGIDYYTVGDKQANYPEVQANITNTEQFYSCKKLAYGSMDVIRTATTQQYIDATEEIKSTIAEMLTMYQLQYSVTVKDFTVQNYPDMLLDTVRVDFKSVL